jgi:hypothetical protein
MWFQKSEEGGSHDLHYRQEPNYETTQSGLPIHSRELNRAYLKWESLYLLDNLLRAY